MTKLSKPQSPQSYWLMKSEPDVFSYDDLLAKPKQISCWEGVRNYQARNFMRDNFNVGDLAFFYHSSCETPGIAGIVEIARAGYPDHFAMDPKSDYFDEASFKKKESKWIMVDVKANQKFSRVISLQELRGFPALSEMVLLRKGSRLSIQPVTRKEFQFIEQLSAKPPQQP